ncbi:uncharacterized protein ACNLHF_003097 [Anomaloglossus baeobatrachus]
MCSKTGVAASTANHEGEQAEGGPLCLTSLDLSLAASFLQRRDQCWRKIKGMDSDMSLSPPDEAMPVSKKRAASSMEKPKPEPKKAKPEPEPKAEPENETFLLRVRGRKRWKIFHHLNDTMEAQDKIIRELKTQK